MRPLRFILLVACFIAIPVFLTCLSLLSGHSSNADVLQRPQRSRLRALFSFSTPSALFPPSAIISLKYDNSTFFLARPAAFGPSLPSRGLSGRLWIGRGFGDDTPSSSDADIKKGGFELGCSDVPGWGDDHKKTPKKPATDTRAVTKATDNSVVVDSENSLLASDINIVDGFTSDGKSESDQEDGTDDHLHRPLQDSNPAPVVKPGEPANSNAYEKQRKPTHADIESLQESADIAGKIVMLSRGGCGFLEKVKWAQRRGGVAVVVGDNERTGQLTIMYAKGDTSNVTIPAIFTSYTSAHLLSSLVPPELQIGLTPESKKPSSAVKDTGFDPNTVKSNHRHKNGGPVFTTSTSLNVESTTKPESIKVVQPDAHGWIQNVLQAVGLDDTIHGEDSRRPPGSGNIEWIQVKDWDNDDIFTATTTGTQSTTISRATTTTSKNAKAQITTKAGDDDFVIGVQDWRDPELLAPKSTSTATDQKGKKEKTKDEATNTQTAPASKGTELKGGSIIPGSGEYEKPEKDAKDHHGTSTTKDDSAQHHHRGFLTKLKSWFGKSSESEKHHAKDSKKSQAASSQKYKDEDDDGLWVTLTPASVSTSPFFDTLLVLVVSPLITLTFVYGLLLLRSRLRRRRWRAPKSVVERLPVRTYQTMSSSSSTTSASLPSPEGSQAASPQLRPEPIRSRQRSQTTTGVLSSSSTPVPSPPPEKSRKLQAKKYKGRQVECVVCLEEYIDGESKVMSLPCGHEFHADCITPWLVNKRRTCPICKGDVVRSLQRAGTSSNEDNREPEEESAEDVQDRAAMTVPEDPVAASIPIPERQDMPNVMDEDVERGGEEDARDDPQRPVASRWRGIVNASISNLSGDTLWRTGTPEDRDR